MLLQIAGKHTVFNGEWVITSYLFILLKIILLRNNTMLCVCGSNESLEDTIYLTKEVKHTSRCNVRE